MSALDDELASLGTMPSPDLRARWSELTGGPAPRISPALLRLALAWELQAKALGGLSRETLRTLDQLERGLTRTTPARAGMRLVREWGGKAHVVTIDEERRISWNGRHWNSLSEVARAITGTHWSGPAFFGLKRKAAA
jgi:hypothetical protein